MGFTTASVRLINPKNGQYADLELLVDSGALYSLVPAQLLESIGIVRKWRQNFILASGETIARWVGEVIFKFGEREATAPAIFGEGNDKPVLGVVTLEVLGLEIDPVTRKLKPAPGLLLINEG